jgi:hypothetical protein
MTGSFAFMVTLLKKGFFRVHAFISSRYVMFSTLEIEIQTAIEICKKIVHYLLQWTI